VRSKDFGFLPIFLADCATIPKSHSTLELCSTFHLVFRAHSVSSIRVIIVFNFLISYADSLYYCQPLLSQYQFLTENRRDVDASGKFKVSTTTALCSVDIKFLRAPVDSALNLHATTTFSTAMGVPSGGVMDPEVAEERQRVAQGS
jgi:hypothetical protein